MMNSRPTKKPDSLRGPFRGLRSTLSRLLASKRFILVLSFMAAIIIWSALVASDGTLPREKVFPYVAAGVTGESTLKSRGFIVMDDIKEMVPGVRLSVEVAQQSYSRVSGASYNPHFDLSKITDVGENTIPVSFSSTLYGPVISCEPDSVTVNVERYVTRRVPVVLEMMGFAPENVYLDSYRIDPNMLSVSGPQSQVSKVARAVAKLDLEALSVERASDRTALDIELQGSSGNAIVSDKLEITNQTVITDSVVVETEVVPAVMVPIELESMVTGKPAAGYELVSVYAEQDALRVAAKPEVLGAIEYLTTENPMSIEGADSNVSGYVRLKRMTGVENTLPLEIAITAEIAEKTTERTMRLIDVDVSGLGEGLSAKLSDKQITVQLTGAHSFIEGLVRDNVRLYVDVTDLQPGSYVIPVQIHIDNATSFTCALSQAEVTVTIEKKP